jgi:hypothetical protein
MGNRGPQRRQLRTCLREKYRDFPEAATVWTPNAGSTDWLESNYCPKATVQ